MTTASGQTTNVARQGAYVETQVHSYNYTYTMSAIISWEGCILVPVVSLPYLNVVYGNCGYKSLITT